MAYPTDSRDAERQVELGQPREKRGRPFREPVVSPMASASVDLRAIDFLAGRRLHGARIVTAHARAKIEAIEVARHFGQEAIFW